MQYDLTVSYTLSKVTPDLKEFLTDFVTEANAGILKKGAVDTAPQSADVILNDVVYEVHISFI